MKETDDLGEDKMNDNYKLLVNGKNIDADNLSFNYQQGYAELPLTVILKELGAGVKWQGELSAQITYNGKEYHLDATKGTLTEAGMTFNILSVAPGSKHGIFYKYVNGELVVDSDSSKLLITNIMGAKMNIDFDKKTVSIN